MTEIAQLIESALQQNRASLLRKAALNTVSRMPATTTLRDLLQSEAGDSIRTLTLQEFAEALAPIAREASVDRGIAASRPRHLSPASSPSDPPAQLAQSARHGAHPAGADDEETPAESREAQIFRQIIEACADTPLTIGQLAKQVEVDLTELRGYLNWMKKNGRIASVGRARSTRYYPA